MSSVIEKTFTCKPIELRNPYGHAYDEFLARLTRGPIAINNTPAPGDGEVRSMGRFFEVTRTVVRLEFAGYQYLRNYTVPRPYVREVFSCGHSEETTLGQYNWKRPRKTTNCFQCSKAIPPAYSDEEDILAEVSKP